MDDKILTFVGLVVVALVGILTWLGQRLGPIEKAKRELARPKGNRSRLSLETVYAVSMTRIRLHNSGHEGANNLRLFVNQQPIENSDFFQGNVIANVPPNAIAYLEFPVKDDTPKFMDFEVVWEDSESKNHSIRQVIVLRRDHE